MYREKHYDYSGKEGKRIKEDLKSWGFHHLTIYRLPADFFRMSKSQLEKLFEHASDAFISKMYDVTIHQIQNRRSDYDIKQFKNTLNRMEREDETVQVFKEILRIVSNEYNNGNIPHTNSTPLNSEKEFLYMKATGIVRRIDDLGRVVIPKEIRRVMRIREGDPLEIYTESDGSVVFRKYSPVGELSRVSAEYAEAINRSSGIPIAICDRDSVIAVAGVSRKEYLEKPISNGLSGVLSSRRSYSAEGKNTEVTVTDGGGEVSYLSPIVSEGSVIGAVMSLKQNGKSPDGSEKKLVDAGAYFMSSQTEI